MDEVVGRCADAFDTLRQEMSPADYVTLVAGLQPAQSSDGALILYAPNPWVAERAEELIGRRLQDLVGAEAVLFRVGSRGGESAVIEEEEPAPELRSLSQFTTTSIEWLWYPRIAVGKLTLIAGDPGLGKSFLTLDLAARLTVGGEWPDGSPIGEPQNVTLLAIEDDPSDTIRPRMEAMGADLDRVHLFRIARSHIPRVSEAESHNWYRSMLATQTKMLIIDPLSAFEGEGDASSNKDVRAELLPLQMMAARCGLACVMVAHLNKSSSGPAIYRVSGSIAYVAAVRTAHGVIADPNDAERRFVMPMKNNIGPTTGGLAYRIRSDEQGMPVVKWEAGMVHQSMDSVMYQQQLTAGRQDVADWIMAALAEGPREVSDLQLEAEGIGHSWRTVKAVKATLPIESFKEEFRGPWIWKKA